MRTIQLAFLLFTVRRKFLSSWALCNTYHFSHYRSNRFSPSFSSTTFQNFPGINRLLSEVYSKLQRHTKLCYKCSTLLVRSLSVFSITNEMQLIQCSLLLSVLYMFRAVFSAHHQELIKLYMQPWVLSCSPAVYCWCGWVGSNASTPAVDSRKA